MIPITFLENDIVALGTRLDNATYRMNNTVPGTWAHTYWTGVVQCLQEKWARMSRIGRCVSHRGAKPAVKVRYDWLQDVGGHNLSWVEGRLAEIFDRDFTQAGLDRSWVKARDEKYSRAVRGLV